MKDVSIQNEGNIFLFHLHTQAAKAWAKEYVQEDAQYFGDALVVEHRFVETLFEYMQDADLTFTEGD